MSDHHGEATFRPTSTEWSYLKIHGPLAQTLFDGLTGPHVEVRGDTPASQKRRGVHLLGSTKNLIDGTVVEIRFDHVGNLAVCDVRSKLYHSLEANRHGGRVVLDGDMLWVDGEAAEAMGEHIGSEVDRVGIRLVNVAEGVAELVEPLPAWRGW